MKDLIRTPLQFVRPMTDTEWQELMLRAGHRERQRVERHQRHSKARSIEQPCRQGGEQLKRSACPASL